ncbi:hypothetical protein BCON_0250g00010 [Botryotinia convoluta]|uniref:Aminoglycoside phosphotransferase domain-containing protein n=1 Tax=Botryotinia convoluta TaxID=54673 RepID=A0A4Z1HGB5_9HELO|nr:hypothetical protein BCON_0250g00010 [Botryotinia convoluta]
MHNLTSSKTGGPSGIIIPPYRILEKTENQMWNPPTKDCSYVFCHMDLSQHNIIVDPLTLKIKAIIDFEYSGFWPMQFELPFYTRLGPSSVLVASRPGLEQHMQSLDRVTQVPHSL